MNRLVFGILFTIIVTVGASFAEPLRQLPDIQLMSLQGEKVAGVQLSMPEKWLIIYLSGNEKNDRPLLAALQEIPDDLTARVTVVVPEATISKLEALCWQNDKMVNTRWFSDTNRSAAKSLQLAGSATILGLNATTISWIVGGTVKDYKVLRSLMADWLQ